MDKHYFGNGGRESCKCLSLYLLNHVTALGAAHSAYCHREAVSQETIRNTGAGTASLEFGNTGMKCRKSVGLICLVLYLGN